MQDDLESNHSLTIGDLSLGILRSAEPKDTPIQKPLGPANNTPTAAEQTGEPTPTTTSLARIGSSPRSPEKIFWRAGMTYQEIERQLKVWWPLRYVSRPRMRRLVRSWAPGGFLEVEDGTTGSLELRPGFNPGDVERTREFLVAVTAPADKTQTAKALAKLSVMVAMRTPDQADLTMEAYVEEARAYPPDVIAHVCREWAAAEKWWPSWAELRERLEAAMENRRAFAEEMAEWDDRTEAR